LAIYAAVPGLAGNALLFGLMITLLAIVAVPAASSAEREFGHDGGPIVVDEIVGQWIAIAGLPATPLSLGAAFFFFRAFDVLKPFPAGRSQKLPGGWGVLADDVFAGIYAAIATRVLIAAIG
jgi:phosphatidylglycerophosphatase A